MKNTIVVMSSNREVERQTKHTLQTLANLGAILLMETGSADVAFARCRALSWACDKLREYPGRDIVLMLDDDMDVPAETAQAIADKARELGRAPGSMARGVGLRRHPPRVAPRPRRALGILRAERQVL